MRAAIIDKLMDFCEQNAAQIAEQWYKSLSTNPRTTNCLKLSKDGCIRHAMNIYRNMKEMFFAKDCYKAVEHILDVGGFVEDFFARGIPPEEVVYALILMRRHIWLYADSQALFNLDTNDMYNAVACTTRVLLVFDYATYLVVKKYPVLAANKII
jgi:hypothetical protein